MPSVERVRLRSLRWIAVLAASLLVVAGVDAQPKQPASTRLAALEAEQSKALAEVARLQAEELRLQGLIDAKQSAYDSYLDPLKNTEGFLAGHAAKGALTGTNPLDSGLASLTERNAIWREIKDLKAQQKKLAQQEARLNQQIEARARTIAYYTNPLAGDLANERARLNTLKGQKPGADDGGQLEWDKRNTQQRIKELEEQFQQGAGSGASGQSQAGSQGMPIPSSYTNPTGGPNSNVTDQTTFCWSDATQSWYPTNVAPCPPTYTNPIYPRPLPPPAWPALAAGGGVIVAPGGPPPGGFGPPGPPMTKPGGPVVQPNSGAGAGAAQGGSKPGAPGAPPTLAQAPANPAAPKPSAASGGQCDQPVCNRAGQEDCQAGVLPNSANWFPACYANMLKRCQQGVAGGSGSWCVLPGADKSCEARAKRVCEGK